MNREQRRKTAKVNGMQPNEEVELQGIMLLFSNGKTANIDIHKVKLVDRESGEELFKYQETKE